MTDRDLLLRVQRLEHNYRVLRRWSSIVLVTGVAIFLIGQVVQTETPAVVRAKKFEAVDSNGRVGVTIRGESIGGSVTISDSEGKDRVSIGLPYGHEKDTRSVLLALYRADGEQVVGLTDDPSLSLWGVGKEDRLMMGWNSRFGFLTMGGIRAPYTSASPDGDGLKLVWPAGGSEVRPTMEIRREGKSIFKAPVEK